MTYLLSNHILKLVDYYSLFSQIDAVSNEVNCGNIHRHGKIYVV